MGTRCWWGLVWRVYYLYNHFDSSWKGLGVELVQELFETLMRDPSFQSWKDQLDSRTQNTKPVPFADTMIIKLTFPI